MGLKPDEFWNSQPKDIIMMHEGYLLRRKYEEAIQLNTLRLLRFNAYINYLAIPSKKTKKVKMEMLYPLPYDKKGSDVSKEFIKEFFDRKEPVITNGKLRGYLVNGVLEKLN